MPSLPEVCACTSHTIYSWYCGHDLTTLHADNDNEHDDDEHNDDDDADDTKIMTSISVVIISISQAKGWTGRSSDHPQPSSSQSALICNW